MKLMAWVLLTGILAAPALAKDLCSAATASATIAEVKAGESTFDARGTWQAGGGAAGVLLEYRINSDRLRSETWLGTSGTWEVVGMDPEEAGCGRRTLRIVVSPSVQDGERLLHCLKKGVSEAHQFEISCAPVAEIVDCAWKCVPDEIPECTGTCTGTARRGRLRYMPFWGVNGEEWQQGAEAPSKGPWTRPVTCNPGQRISFKVRDHEEDGPWSQVDEIGCGVTE